MFIDRREALNLRTLCSQKRKEKETFSAIRKCTDFNRLRFVAVKKNDPVTGCIITRTATLNWLEQPFCWHVLYVLNLMRKTPHVRLLTVKRTLELTTYVGRRFWCTIDAGHLIDVLLFPPFGPHIHPVCFDSNSALFTGCFRTFGRYHLRQNVGKSGHGSQHGQLV